MHTDLIVLHVIMLDGNLVELTARPVKYPALVVQWRGAGGRGCGSRTTRSWCPAGRPVRGTASRSCSSLLDSSQPDRRGLIPGGANVPFVNYCLHDPASGTNGATAPELTYGHALHAHERGRPVAIEVTISA